MIEPKKVMLLAAHGNTLAELRIVDEEEGWFTGTVVWQRFPADLQKALTWYDEIVRDQMLSYLDDAVAAVAQFELQAQFPDGSAHNTYSLHVSPSHEVSFRTSPVLPLPELPKPAIR